MNTDADSAAEWPDQALNGFSMVSLPAVTLDGILNMAGFMRDFRPVEFFCEQGAAGRRPLHPMWVSALVGETVRRNCTAVEVKRLSIHHVAGAFEGGSLHVGVAAIEGPAVQDRVAIWLEVVGEKGKVLATATAEVVSSAHVTGG